MGADRAAFPSQLRTVLEMIKFEHTLFALPFAFLGMILAAEGWPALRRLPTDAPEREARRSPSIRSR